jgi:DNA-binding transcriptional MerR regulator
MAVKNRINIGDFVKLTGSTLKTINYYHKIGLLPAPERSAGGYRLYGPAELNRMRLIKRLKSLGLGLRQIKEVTGDLQDPKTSREVLQSLRLELLGQMKTLGERVAKIDTLLGEDALLVNEDSLDSPSFQMITEIMGAEQIEKYAQACPEKYDQHRKLYGILDDLQWGEDYQEIFRALAEYFKMHPEHYQLALDSGERWARLARLSEDDPQVEAWAREAVALINSMPAVKELICKQPGMKKPLESIYQEMAAGVLSPAQLKYQQLFEKFLSAGG